MKKGILLALFIGAGFTALMAQNNKNRGRIPVYKTPSNSNVNNSSYQRNQASQRAVRYNSFEPSVNISIGYGLPSVDEKRMADFFGANRGNASQNGTWMGSLDYRFSKSTSLGVMVTHSNVSAPYYINSGADYGDPYVNGQQKNTAVMVNMVNYFGNSNSAVNPYLRTAAGVNIWDQTYTEVANGKPMDYVTEPGKFAYQASLGAQIKLSKNAGLFLEAGYGKYIAAGGLTFSF